MANTTTPKIIAVAATAIGALGMLTIPFLAGATPPVPLAPPDCRWTVAGPEITIISPAGIPVIMTSPDGRTFDNGSFTSKAGMLYAGPASGGVVDGTNRLDFTARFGMRNSPDPDNRDYTSYQSHFVGTIAPWGAASGTVLDDKGETKNWSTAGGFACVA